MGAASSWSFGLKILFRFFFIYFVLYTFPFPLSVFDLSFPQIWDGPIVWLGKVLFHIDITVQPNGSGDTTWNYVQVLLFALVAVLGCIVWTATDRDRQKYSKLYFWLTVLIRYYLASTMISYGMYKIIKTQFPFPQLGRLVQPYGESSPMGLLWTFMGYSTAYNFFIGMAEAVGGFLLFFKRTRMLGALICIAVMSNVAMLNFTYDVPVKLFSLHLLFMAMFLVGPDVIRLLNFFVLNRSSPVEEIRPLFKGTKWFYPYVGAKTLFIGFVIISLTVMILQNQKQWGDSAAKSELYGIWEVNRYAINGDTLPPLMNDTKRWKRILIDGPQWTTIEYMDNAKMYYRFASDTTKGKVSVLSQDSSSVYEFDHKRIKDLIVWNGGSKVDTIFVELKRLDPKEFLLVNRGFNWINEYPFNR